jgi:TonB family protein
MPAYPGGDDELMEDIYRRIKYPELAEVDGVLATVYVSYIIGVDGSIYDVKVVRGVHPLLDAEAVRVVSGITGYQPGKQRGIPVPVQFTVPIMFDLR